MSMNRLPWKPWREALALREDVRSGELSLKIFAADLYDVVMDSGPAVYRDPAEFFALTYPTHALRGLARDVMMRLAGKSDKAIRQLELTYGGGKTHALIAMYHLANNPAALPDLPAVEEFVNEIGFRPPRARVAVLAFDKLDVEKGMEIRAPDGQTRWLRQPWSVLAYQIAGSEGLRLLSAEGEDAERDSAPAENLLATLLEVPAREDLGTLILIDEVLMYAREKVGLHPEWKDRLANFFQYLTQAAAKTNRCAIVASLLATDPMKSDTLGREILTSMQSVFLRESEEGVQPVGQSDVAEVLRRRFFTAESIRDRAAFRPNVVAALKGVASLDEQTRRDEVLAEDRYVQSYPFHPDLTAALYTKWTQLERFQRTRGILRTFALALRSATQWDESPLVGPNVFLAEPGTTTLSEAARELASAAVTEDGAGSRQEWSVILESELAKARAIQEEFPALRYRVIEQAVLATFLHSQPIGQKAQDRDLYVLLGPTRPDRIELEKGLKRWTEVSWFLDERSSSTSGTSGANVSRSWRLGSRPNLRQMHYDACQRVGPQISSQVLDEIRACKSLTSAASGSGVRVHILPASPSEVEDDGRFHFAVLGPSAVSDSGKPSSDALRFLTDTTSPDRPRAHRNAILLAVPSREGVEGARVAARDYLGWDAVERLLASNPEADSTGVKGDPTREGRLRVFKQEAKAAIPDAIRQAYCIVVTYDERGEPQAFKLPASTEPLFTQIKADPRARIQETRIEADALLPGGPYNLWREGETTRRVSHLLGAFTSDPRLPKMLNRAAIADTLVEGCREGALVLRLPRPDGTYQTFWRLAPDSTIVDDRALEAILPEAAELTILAPSLLIPDALPGLWHGPSLAIREVMTYFAGGKVVNVVHAGFEQPQAVPCAARPVIEESVSAAVAQGMLWLTTEHAGFLREEVPAGLLDDNAEVRFPPAPVSVLDLQPGPLPGAWQDHTATVASIAEALSAKAGRKLPWFVVCTAITGALQAGVLERVASSGNWPCDTADARFVMLQVPATRPPQPPPPPLPPETPGAVLASAILASHEIQNVADNLNDLILASIGYRLTFTLSIALAGDGPVPIEVVARLNELLKDVSSSLKLTPHD